MKKIEDCVDGHQTVHSLNNIEFDWKFMTKVNSKRERESKYGDHRL